jgi:hypothetical protein
VVLWDVGRGERVRRFNLVQSVSAVNFAPDGRTVLAATPGEVVFLDAGTGRTLRRFAAPRAERLGMALSPDGRTLAVAGGVEEPVLQLRDVPGGRLRTFPRPLPHREWATLRVAFSPGGRTVAVGDGEDLVLWDVATGQASRRSGGTVFAFSPDSRLLVTGGGAVVVAELATGQPVAQWHGFEGTVRGLVLSANSRYLVSGSDDLLLVWDVTPVGMFPEEAAKGPLTAKERERCWEALAAGAVEARKAMARLQANPAQAVALLREKLRPVAAPDEAQVLRWIDDLGARSFGAREAAARELEALRGAAVPLMRRKLVAGVPLETARRLQRLVRPYANLEMEAAGEPLRTLRALEVLERLATPAAREALERLAGGFDQAEETQLARAALRRLAGHH